MVLNQLEKPISSLHSSDALNSQRREQELGLFCVASKLIFPEAVVHDGPFAVCYHTRDFPASGGGGLGDSVGGVAIKHLLNQIKNIHIQHSQKLA